MKLGQGNIFTSVCQEFCPRGGGVSASVHAGIPPGTRHTPPDQADPPRPGRPVPPDQGEPPQDQGEPPPPRDQGETPPGPRRTPPGPRRTPPGTKENHPPGRRLHHTVNERPVRILLECNLVFDNANADINMKCE